MFKIESSRDAYELIDATMAKVGKGTANDQDMKHLMLAHRIVKDLAMERPNKDTLISILANTYLVVSKNLAKDSDLILIKFCVIQYLSNTAKNFNNNCIDEVLTMSGESFWIEDSDEEPIRGFDPREHFRRITCIDVDKFTIKKIRDRYIAMGNEVIHDIYNKPQ